jgi:hypothetical protein
MSAAKIDAAAASQKSITDPSYTIAEFCLAEGMTKVTYHKLRNLGQGPREMRIGAMVRITHKARLDWQKARENPTGAEAAAVEKMRRGLRTRSHAAAARAVKSPQHVSRRKRA